MYILQAKSVELIWPRKGGSDGLDGQAEQACIHSHLGGGELHTALSTGQGAEHLYVVSFL